MRLIFIFSILLISVLKTYSQELKAQVQVVAPQIANVDPNIFKQLETSCNQFLNNTKWTSDIFAPEEKIECSFLINITESPSSDYYKGTIQVSSRRPVYASSYTCSMLNIKDEDFNINYIPFQVMEFSEQSNLSNLTSILAFYAYYVIALDYDSFSPEGGSPYFKKAQNIVLNAQGSSEKGWKSFENNRNRYWMVDDMLNPAFKTYRQMMYTYHRQGFDLFAQDYVNARKTAMESLKSMEEIYKQRPNAFLLQIFFNTKRDEAISMLKDAPKNEIQPVVQAIAKIDGAFASRWTDLLKTQ